jgi:excisionase family DNA binding protein
MAMKTELDQFGDVLTVREVARLLRVNKDAAYLAIHSGVIPHFKIGRSIRVPRAGLQKLLGTEPLIENEAADATTPAAPKGGRDALATARR